MRLRRPVVIGIAVLSISTAASIVVAEILLAAGSAFVPAIDRVTRKASGANQPLIPDPRLGMRGNPKYPGHDQRGFRNPVALDSAAVVTLGDSHTYGTSVGRDDAWPHQLSASTRQTVYNMGLAGYGPGQALEGLSAALELKPKLVVFALYFGNDFYDSFEFAQMHKTLRTFISSEVALQIDSLEEMKTIEADIGFLFARASGAENAEATSAAQRGVGLRDFLSDHSRVWGLARTIRGRIAPPAPTAVLAPDFDQARKALTPAQLPYVSLFDGASWKTIFTSPYRLRVEDDRDPRIRAGVEIAKRQITEMRERAESNSARFLVVLLPTKEYVFWPKVPDPSQHPALSTLVAMEERLHHELEASMAASGVAYVDPAAELRRSTAQPYFMNADGHPNPIGHRIIARTVERYMLENGLAVRNRVPKP
jgi:hypothetical protein